MQVRFCAILMLLPVVLLCGCNDKKKIAAPQTQPVEKPKVTQPDDHSPELWVCGGMGSFAKIPNELYIAGVLRKKVPGAEPDVCITSGTQESGPNSIQWNLIDTPKWLDADANKQASWALRMFIDPKKDKGHFLKENGKTKIIVILAAPCTQTLPPKSNDRVEIDVYLMRDPRDKIPNQQFSAPRNQAYFSRFGKLDMVHTQPDLCPGITGMMVPGGVQGYHHFSGYWQPELDIVQQDKLTWKPTGKKAKPIDLLANSLQDKDADYIFIGHSQGANIIMKMLEIGCDDSGEKTK